MKSSRDEFLHAFSAEEISTTIKTGAWKYYNHEVSSAITNTNDDAPSSHLSTNHPENTSGTDAYRDIDFNESVASVLDVGGGKYDFNRDYMREERGIGLLVWDPYNRTYDNNELVRDSVSKSPVDAAVSMSVLNVVPDLKSRLAHIVTLWSALKIDGKAYFKIWPGDGALRGSYHPIETESYYQANAFPDRFYREIQSVFGVENVIMDELVPNLIVATRASSQYLTCREIVELQNLSRDDLVSISRHRLKLSQRVHAMQGCYSSCDALFFKRMDDVMIERIRHQNAATQNAYDKRFGLIRS